MKATVYYQEPCGVRHFTVETKDLSNINYYVSICPNEYTPVIVLDDGTSCITVEPIKQENKNENKRID